MEIWDQLSTQQTKRQLLLDSAQQIRQTCIQDHSKQSIYDCLPCYETILDALRARYLDSSDAEWFFGRRAFLQDLEALFSSAKRLETDPRAIEECIAEEKRRWYREMVRSVANRLIVEDVECRDDIINKVQDRDLGFEELVKGVGEAMRRLVPGAPSGGDADLGTLVDEITAAKEPLDRLEIYREAFFSAEGDAAQLEKQQKYLDMLKSGTSMGQVVLGILEDRQASVVARLQKEKHVRRLDELRRGRTAHELQKTRKTKDRESSAEEAHVSEEFYELPPCAVCSRTPDPSDFLACCLCQVLVGLGVLVTSTVYCSRDCYTQGHESHLEQAHLCASGDKCLSLGDEDVDMDAAHAEAHLCKDCVDSLSIPSVFCSQRCAHASFQTHREQVHLPARKRLGLDVDDSERLVFGDGDDKSKYHARDIKEHLVPAREAVREFEEKTGISVSIVE